MSSEPELSAGAAGPVTATVTRRVKPGHEAAYEQFLVVVGSAPLIGPLPLVPRLAVTTLVTVCLMTWVVMPRVTRLLHRWLYPSHRR